MEKFSDLYSKLQRKLGNSEKKSRLPNEMNKVMNDYAFMYGETEAKNSWLTGTAAWTFVNVSRFPVHLGNTV